MHKGRGTKCTKAKCRTNRTDAQKPTRRTNRKNSRSNASTAAVNGAQESHGGRFELKLGGGKPSLGKNFAEVGRLLLSPQKLCFQLRPLELVFDLLKNELTNRVARRTTKVAASKKQTT